MKLVLFSAYEWDLVGSNLAEGPDRPEEELDEEEWRDDLLCRLTGGPD